MTVPTIAGVGIFFLTLAIHLAYDLKKRVNINHKIESRFRLIGLIPATILISIPISWSAVAVPLIVMSVYWFLFDGLFNIFRKYNWWFTGTNDPDDAATDNFLQKLTLTQHCLVKIGAIILSLLAYLLLDKI